MTSQSFLPSKNSRPANPNATTLSRCACIDILDACHYVKSQAFEGKTKTGLIVGMGERKEEVTAVLKDISKLDVDIVTIGQYLRPTAKHRPIDRYAPEEEFEHYKLIGESFGIPHVESGPLVRSSYHAKDSFASV